MTTRYIEIDSTYRNRRQYPKPAEFVVETNVYATATNKYTAIEPITDEMSINKWRNSEFMLSNTGAATKGIRLRVVTQTLPDLASYVNADRRNHILTSIISDTDIEGHGGLQPRKNYYYGSTIHVNHTPVTTARIIDYEYLGSNKCLIKTDVDLELVLTSICQIVDPSTGYDSSNTLKDEAMIFVPGGPSRSALIDKYLINITTGFEYKITSHDHYRSLIKINYNSNVLASTDTLELREVIPSLVSRNPLDLFTDFDMTGAPIEKVTNHDTIAFDIPRTENKTPQITIGDFIEIQKDTELHIAALYVGLQNKAVVLPSSASQQLGSYIGSTLRIDMQNSSTPFNYTSEDRVVTSYTRGVGNLTLTAGGSGYTDAPAVTITGGGGVGASAVTLLTAAGITGFTVSSGGSGYISTPTVKISGGGGSGATGTVNITAGAVISVSLTASGSGYTSVPTVEIINSSGFGAQVVATLAAQSVASIVLLSPGLDYDEESIVVSIPSGNPEMGVCHGAEIWTSRTSATDNDWSGIAYGNGLFVTVSETGTGDRVMTSPDGITWTSRVSAVDNNWSGIAYGGGLFAAVASSGTGNRVMTSPNGTTWTSRVTTSSSSSPVNLFNGVPWNHTASCYFEDARDIIYFFYYDGVLGKVYKHNATTNTTTIHDIGATSGATMFLTLPNNLPIKMAELASSHAVHVFWDGAYNVNRIGFTSETTGDSTPYAFAALGDDVQHTAQTDDEDRAVSNAYRLSLGTIWNQSLWTSGGDTNFTYTAGQWGLTATPYNGLPRTGIQSVSRIQSDGLQLYIFYNTGVLYTVNLETKTVTSSQPYGGDTDTPDNYWESITYGNGLFAAVSSTGTDNRVMTSPDGTTWTSRVSPSSYPLEESYVLTIANHPVISSLDGVYVSVGTLYRDATSKKFRQSLDHHLFRRNTSTNTYLLYSEHFATSSIWYVGVYPVLTTNVSYVNHTATSLGEISEHRIGQSWNAFSSGTGNYPSPNGTTEPMLWTITGVHTAASGATIPDNIWKDITYGDGLFVAVSETGTGNRVMTSPDGITWTSRVSAADNEWMGIAYGNGLFVAVSSSGTGNRVMTSPDGITWTIRVSAADNDWEDITYGDGLFVAVSETGTGNRIMSSPDGITWTIRVSAVDNNWSGIAYGGGLFAVVASSGTGNRVITSNCIIATATGTLSMVATVDVPYDNVLSSYSTINARIFSPTEIRRISKFVNVQLPSYQNLPGAIAGTINLLNYTEPGIEGTDYPINLDLSTINGYYKGLFVGLTTDGISFYYGYVKDHIVIRASSDSKPSKNYIIVDDDFIASFIVGTNSVVISCARTETFNRTPYTKLPTSSITERFSVLKYTKDNYSYLSHRGMKWGGYKTSMKYMVSLMHLILPNRPLKNGKGGYITQYPYVYVRFQNNRGGRSMQTNDSFYSNNPNAEGKTFRVLISNTVDDQITNFVTLVAGDISQTQTFSLDDNIDFAVFLPDGSLFETIELETLQPDIPNREIQISALFSLTNIE
jgi:hypothetical protein